MHTDFNATGVSRQGVDDIVNFLHQEIMSMRLLPGTRISESDIATRFGVSRQPVRDAFRRLEVMDLILVRPKKATEVKRLSLASIEKSRFVREAVETAVLRKAAVRCNSDGERRLQENIDLQTRAVEAQNQSDFAGLDYAFHEIICGIAGLPFAFEVIREEKQKVDRLCILGFANAVNMRELLEDHIKIATAIKAGDGDVAVQACEAHLRRLDDTVANIRRDSSVYFSEE